MRKVRNKRRFYGLAVIVLIVCITVGLWTGKYMNERNAAQLQSLRYERVIPIYSAEEEAAVLELLDEQVDTNRMNEAEENENICVWYSLTGKVYHKDVFDRFLRNVEQGVEDAVIVVESDWEARLNVHFISYRESEFFYVLDSEYQYHNEEPLMRTFEYGKVFEDSIRLSVTEDEKALDVWDEAWWEEAENVAAAYENGEMSWDEYGVWLVDRREQSKERPYVYIGVREQSLM